MSLTSSTGLGVDGLWCAVDGDSIARCWFWDVFTGDAGGERAVLKTFLETGPGYVEANDGGGPSYCALAADGAVDCWILRASEVQYVYDSEDFPDPIHIEGPILDFDFAYWWWAARADGSLVKYDYTDNGAVLEEIPGDYRRVAAWNETVCGLTSEGRIDCYGEGCTYGMCNAPTDSGWVDLTLGWIHGCALHGDGRVACWGPDDLPSEGIEDLTLCGQNTPPDERFVQIDASYFFTCGVRTDGYAMCWGNPASSTPPP